MPQIKHKNKWYQVKGIEKCDDGITYQVDGIEGKVYAKDVSDFRLNKEDTHEIINPDGSITRGPGKEPLRKPLKKSLFERWELIKATINHENAFMDMVDGDEAYDNKAQEAKAGPEEGEASDNTKASSDDKTLISNIQDPDKEDDSDAVRGINTDVMGSDAASNSDSQEAGSQGDGGQPDTTYDEAQLIELLRQEGYLDPEIAHIVHGHVPGEQSPESKAISADEQREQEKHDHHMDRMKGQTDIQTDHAKRMADLEYEHAKREKDLRIKHLEEELKTKLEQLKNKGKLDGKAN